VEIADLRRQSEKKWNIGFALAVRMNYAPRTTTGEASFPQHVDTVRYLRLGQLANERG
jgi:hypothetical protein